MVLGRAKFGLVKAGRIAVILDGLDEITEDLRPVTLRALSQQAISRVVVLAHSFEMAAAAQRGFLEGAVALELQDVGPTAAADYLTRVQLDPPPRGWSELTGRLRREPDSPIAKALSNPLTLTLVRDTYRSGDDIRELLDFCDAVGDVSGEDIQDHLLDRVLPAAYTPSPGAAPPRYGLEEARRALGHVAARMSRDGTRDLAWWRIPAWASAGPRVITTGVVFALLFALGGRPAYALVGGAVLACLYLLGDRRRSLSRPGAGDMSPLTPRDLWRRDQAFGLAVGLMLGLGLSLGIGLGGGLILALGLGSRQAAGHAAGLVHGLMWLLVFGLVYGLLFPQTWTVSLAFAQLAMRWHTPARLLRFLDDARQRDVLRTVGPVYPFRHARLQDRLAGQATPK